MIVSQSFKIKNADGSFGNEVKFSTVSDLVFYKDNVNLTTKTTEIINSISTLNGNLSTEISDRQKENTSIRQELATAKSDLQKEIDSDVAAVKSVLQKEIDSDVAAAKSVLQEEIATANASINNLNTLIIGNTNSINTINDNVNTFGSQLKKVEDLIGVEGNPAENTLLALISTLQTNYNNLLKKVEELEEKITELEKQPEEE